ncbi:hypothetical protein [Nocardioides sp. WS12]|uniref:hypothetical protein n=1 Tax=Nocardioides sp. WS12 TaxID=2486272 RepID=UPI0015FB1903|nr:hypothetical protein [Nocardioides sp. WS12]
MASYDAAETLASITDHAIPIVAIGGLSIVAMWVFFIEAARMSRRDRVAPMALWMTVLWWPHDGNYLLRHEDWFQTYDHWFMQLFWFAIIVTFVSESVYVVQTIRYGRDELSPGQTQRVHTLRMVGALAAGVISWSLLKGALDDPLFLISFMGTLLWGLPSAAALLARRRGPAGMSVLEYEAFAAMTWCYSIASVGFFGDDFFRSWPYVGICSAACAWSIVVVVQLRAAGAVRSSWTGTSRRELEPVA